MDTSNTNQLLVDIVISAREQALAVLTAVEGRLVGLQGTAGALAIAMGVLGGAILLHGVQAAAKYQDTLELLRTQAGATQQQVDQLHGSLLNMSMEPMGLSAEKLAEGMYHIESAMQKTTGQSIDNAHALAILHAAAEGAAVGHANLETVVNSLVGVLVSGIGGIHGASDAMAQLNAIVGSGNVRMEEVAQSIGTGVLPVFKEAGLTFRDYAAALATATDNAMPAEMAATRLRMTISLMTAPSKAAVNALASIGITQFQLADDLKKPNGLLVAVEDLKAHMESAASKGKESAAALEEVFSRGNLQLSLEKTGMAADKAGAAIDAAFGRSRSSSMIKLLMDEMDRFSSKYKQQAADAHKFASEESAAVDTVIGRWHQLESQFNAFSIMAADGLMPVLHLVLLGLTDFGSVVGHIASISPQLTTTALGVAAALAVVNIAMLGGPVIAAGWSFALRNLLPVISHTGAIVNSFGNLMRVLTGDTAAATAATIALSGSEALDTLAAEKEQRQQELLTATMLLRNAAFEEAQRQTDLSAAKLWSMTIADDANATALEREAAAADLAAAKTGLLTAQVERKSAAEGVALVRAQLATIASHERAIADEEAAAEAQRLALAEGEAAAGAQAQAVAGGEAAASTGILAGAMDGLAAAGAAVMAVLSPEIIAVGAGAVAFLLLYEKVKAVHDEVNSFVEYMRVAWVGANVAARESLDQLGGGIHDVITGLGTYITDTDHASTKTGAFRDEVRSLREALDLLKPVTDQIGGFFSEIGKHMDVATLAVNSFVETFMPGLNGVLGPAQQVIEKLHQMGQAAIDAENKAAAWRTGMSAGKSIAMDVGNAIFLMNLQISQAAKSLHDYGVQFTNLAAGAYADHEAMLHQDEAQWKMWANATISEAKRSADGIISEINRVKSQLASPLPELRLPATANPYVQGDITSNMFKSTSAGPAMVLAPEAEAALKRLQDAFAGWPPQFKVAMDAASSRFKQHLEDAYNHFVQQYNSENSRHQQALRQLNSDEEQKVKAARDQAQQQMNAAQQSYVQQLHGLNQSHESRLQAILQTFENGFQTILANFQAQESQIQMRAESFTQEHQDALQAMQSSFQAREQEIEAKRQKNGQDWVDQQKQLLNEAYARAIAVENARYQNGIQNIANESQASDASFNRHVTALEASQQSKIDAERRVYEEAVQKLDLAQKNHETAIAQRLKEHVDQLHKTLEDHIQREDALHRQHDDKLRQLFDDHARKLSEALKPPSADKVLNDITSAIQAAYNQALAQSTLDILHHGMATRQDIDALQRAAKARDQLTRAEDEATKASGTYKTAAQEAAAAAKAQRDAAKAQKEAEKAAAEAAKANTPSSQLQAIEQRFTDAMDALYIAEYKQIGAYDDLQAAAVKELEARQRLTEIETRAMADVATAAGDIKDAVDSLQQAVRMDIDRIAADLLAGVSGGAASGGGMEPLAQTQYMQDLHQENDRSVNETHKVLTDHETRLQQIFSNFEQGLQAIVQSMSAGGQTGGSDAAMAALGLSPDITTIHGTEAIGRDAHRRNRSTPHGEKVVHGYLDVAPPAGYYSGATPVNPTSTDPTGSVGIIGGKPPIMVPAPTDPNNPGSGGGTGSQPTPPPAGLDQLPIDLQQLIADYEKLHQLLLLEQQAELQAAIATGDWATVMSVTEQMLKDKMDAAVGEAVAALLGLGGSLDEAVAKMATAATEQEKFNLAKQQAEQLWDDAMIKAATAAGDWVTVMSLVEKKFKDEQDKAIADATAAMLGLGGSVVTASDEMQQAATDQEQLNIAQKDAADLWNTAMVNAALAANDLAAAFDLTKRAIDDEVTQSFNSIVEAINTGRDVTLDMVTTYLTAKHAQDQLTDSTTKAYLAVGDFADYISGQSKKATDDLTNAQAKLAYDILTGNVPAQDADKQSIIELTQKNLALSNATDKAKAFVDSLKPATFDQAQGAELKVLDENTKLIEANTAIIEANSAIQVAALNAMATAIQDQTAVISAQGDVAKVQSDGYVKAIQDQSAISVDQIKLNGATDAQALAAARAQLKIDQDKLRFDMMISSAALFVAEAQLRAAMDKARADAEEAQLQQKVLQDALKVDELKVKLQQDNIQVAQDQLAALVDIDEALGGGTDLQKQMLADQQTIAKDNKDIAQALQQQAVDAAAAAAKEAADKVQQAQDAQMVELAKQRQQQIESQAAITETQDQAAKDQIDAITSAASQSAADITSAIKDMKTELREDFKNLLELEARGLGGLERIDVTGDSANMMNGWASASARQA